jgi:hypothetical protein
MRNSLCMRTVSIFFLFFIIQKTMAEGSPDKRLLGPIIQCLRHEPGDGSPSCSPVSTADIHPLLVRPARTHAKALSQRDSAVRCQSMTLDRASAMTARCHGVTGGGCGRRLWGILRLFPQAAGLTGDSHCFSWSHLGSVGGGPPRPRRSHRLHTRVLRLQVRARGTLHCHAMPRVSESYHVLALGHALQTATYPTLSPVVWARTETLSSPFQETTL